MQREQDPAPIQEPLIVNFQWANWHGQVLERYQRNGLANTLVWLWNFRYVNEEHDPITSGSLC